MTRPKFILVTGKKSKSMIIGIDIKFFEAEKPDEVNDGKLYLNDDGKNYIDFQGTLQDAFRLIKVIFAKAVDSEEKYTLVNCRFKLISVCH